MILSTILRQRKAWQTYMALAWEYSNEGFGARQPDRGDRSGRSDRFGYDSILSRVSVSENLDEIANILKTNENRLGVEHYAMASRVVGRIMRKDSVFENRAKVLAFHHEVEKFVEQMNPQQCLDYLFYLRVLDQQGLLRSDLRKFLSRLDDNIEAKQYTFRNLVSIYHDLGQMGRSVYQAARELNERLEQEIAADNTRNLSIISVVQILRTLGRLQKPGNWDFKIMNSLFGYLNKSFDSDNMSIDDKVQLFCCTAKMTGMAELPKYMELINKELQEQVESLSERNVMNLIECGTSINNSKYSIVKEIRDLFFQNLESDGGSVDIDFVISFLSKLRGDRSSSWLSAKESSIVVNYFMSKLPMADPSRKNHQRLYGLIKRFHMLNFELSEKLMQGILKSESPPNIADLEMAVNFSVDITNHIQNFIKSNKSSIEGKSSRTFLLLNTVQSLTPELQELKTACEKQIDQSIENGKLMEVFFPLEKTLLKDEFKTPILTKLFKALENGDPNNMGMPLQIVLGILMMGSTTREMAERATNIMKKLKLDVFKKAVENKMHHQMPFNNPYQVKTLFEICEFNNSYFQNMANNRELIRFCSKYHFLKKHYYDLLYKSFNVHRLSRFSEDDLKEEAAPAQGSAETTSSKSVESSTKKSEPIKLTSTLESVLKELEQNRFEDVAFREFLTNLASMETGGPIRSIRSLCMHLVRKGILTKKLAENLSANIKKLSSNQTDFKFPEFVTDYFLDSFTNNQALPVNLNEGPKAPVHLQLMFHFPSKLWNENVIKKALELIRKLSPNEWVTAVLNLNQNVPMNHEVTRALLDRIKDFNEVLHPSSRLVVAQKLNSLNWNRSHFFQALVGPFWDKANSISFFDKMRMIRLCNDGRFDTLKLVSKHFDELIKDSHRNLRSFLSVLYDLNYPLNEKDIKTLLGLTQNGTPREQAELLKLLIINESVPGAADAIKKLALSIDPENLTKFNKSLARYCAIKFPELGIKFEEKENLNFQGKPELMAEIKAGLEKIANEVGIPFKPNAKVGDMEFNFQFGNNLILLTGRGTNFSSERLTGRGQLLISSLKLNAGGLNVVFLHPWTLNERRSFSILRANIPELQNNPKYEEYVKANTKQVTPEKEEEEAETKNKDEGAKTAKSGQ